MLVYNLTNKALSFRGRTIPPSGGYLDYPELNQFIPNKDKDLATKKVISFEALPKWFLVKKKQELESKKAQVKKELESKVKEIAIKPEIVLDEDKSIVFDHEAKSGKHERHWKRRS